MYSFKSVEEKWQKIWIQNNTNVTPSISPTDRDNKCYVLEMLPYPSGKIHMGHVRNYCIGDVLVRYKKALGYKVLHPMGWDAFGMPAENAAIQNGTHPKVWTYQNIEEMKNTIISLGLSYDWDRELATCSEEYYGHEQRLFIEIYEKGLVYRKESWVNWDPVDNTVLANEQVIDGKGWRSGADVVKKQLPQWCLRITQYAEELLRNLATLKSDVNCGGWPEKVLTMQENWIGKSDGMSIKFKIIKNSNYVGYPEDNLVIFTTRPETLFGASFCAIACNHPLALLIAQENKAAATFISECQKIPTTECSQSIVEKKGFNTGMFVSNAINQDDVLPIFIANFVLMEYGTGAIFGCPAHDERDFEFATKYNLPIRSVISSSKSDSLPYVCTNGMMINSGFLNGLSVADARTTVCNFLEKALLGTRETTYRLRDWSVSRQRYWGCPIPMIHCKKCGIVTVPKKDLPIVLPDDVDFSVPGNPLDHHPTWKYVKCPYCGTDAERETDTLDTFFESSWYFLRYCSPHDDEPINKKAIEAWMPVDVYIGGIEHAVLHLLYARFFTMVLSDCGYINIREPFTTLLTQGMVCHTSFQDDSGKWLYPNEVEIEKDGKCFAVDDGRHVTAVRSEKMSKSKKNLIDPEQIIRTYGLDALRIFIMSDTPYEKDFDWNTDALDGAWRYLNKMWRLCERINAKYKIFTEVLYKNDSAAIDSSHILKVTHCYLKKINTAFDQIVFHKAIAFHRELTRAIEGVLNEDVPVHIMAEVINIWIRVFAPFAPHFALEAYQFLFSSPETIDLLHWPTLRSELAREDTATIAVQVNGRLRHTFESHLGRSDDELKEISLSNEHVKKFIKCNTVKKVIIVPDKLVNIVTE